MSTTTPIFMEGGFAPVHEEVTARDLAVTGTVPAELNGRLVRIGPNPITPPDPATHHWFFGTGMVHGVRLREGRAEWYRNRYVRDAEVAAAQGVERLPGDRPEDGTTNTHIIGHAGRTFALVEAGSRPVELGYELDSLARCDFDGTLDGSFTAHTKLDPATGELHAVTYHWAWDHLRHVVVGPDARVRRELAVPVAGGPMVHDCAITERFVVLLDLPVTFDMDAAAAGASLPYVWNPAHPPRVGLLPRGGGADEVRWVDAPLGYVFHTLNAYDREDGRVVLDLVRHPRMFDRVRNSPDEGTPSFERWTIEVGSASASGSVQVTELDDTGQEFPRVDERLTGRRHRYGYAAAIDGIAPRQALKHDLDAGTTEAHDYGPGRVTLEPVFVPRSADSGEDDGWVLSTVCDATTGLSDVVILHAQDFTGDPVATIHLPARVPYGFHGSWIAD